MKQSWFNAAIAVVLTAALGSAVAQDSPRSYIQAAADAMLSTTTLSSETERFAALDQVLQDYFELNVVTRAVVGSHTAALSSQQLTRFTNEFRVGLVDLLATALGEIDGYEMEIGTPRMRDEDRAQVPVDVDAGSLGDFEFQFSLARSNGRWNALNLIVNGVNVGLTYRNQFNELMASNDGDVDTVIDIWRDTVAETGPEI